MDGGLSQLLIDLGPSKASEALYSTEVDLGLTFNRDDNMKLTDRTSVACCYHVLVGRSKNRVDHHPSNMLSSSESSPVTPLPAGREDGLPERVVSVELHDVC